LTDDEDVCQSVDDKTGVSDTALTSGKDDTNGALMVLKELAAEDDDWAVSRYDEDGEVVQQICHRLEEDLRNDERKCLERVAEILFYLDRVDWHLLNGNEDSFSGGVRGRQEIQEVIQGLEKQIQKRIGGIKVVNTVMKGSKEHGMIEAYENVLELLGEVDDL